MYILEYIYKGVLEPSYKKHTWADANCAGHIRNKRGKSASSNTHPATGESADRWQKLYIDRLKSKF